MVVSLLSPTVECDERRKADESIENSQLNEAIDADGNLQVETPLLKSTPGDCESTCNDKQQLETDDHEQYDSQIEDNENNERTMETIGGRFRLFERTTAADGPFPASKSDAPVNGDCETTLVDGEDTRYRSLSLSTSDRYTTTSSQPR